ncbi:MAG TPA: GNAT family N-acetyltransferase [Longimicrobiales bacterium]|nr:GNAT family N-acetyltransferase [Longimicrobiales bacterium]
MTITLEPAQTADAFDTVVLRSRAAKAPRIGTAHLFRVLADGAEVGLVVLDLHEGTRCAILYELFLSSPRRNRGIGTKVLATVERHVMGSGWTCLEVWPRSLDRGNRSDAQLIGWYGRHGYAPADAGSERLRKTLAPV